MKNLEDRMIATMSHRNINVRNYTYPSVLAASEKINWRVEDIIGPDKPLDFTRPFMPESLARISQLDFLTRDEGLTLNQIRGNTYLAIFGLVEEFILPFVLDHARPMLDSDDHRTRAFLTFAGEEAKHIQLFRRFREEFERGFGTRCDVIGPQAAIARAVLAHHPLAVALAILQIEWMTLAHYMESINDSTLLDPQFKSLLKHHWLEESQHAKLDTLMVQAIADSCSEAEIANAIGEYAEIGGLIDGGLKQQTEFDLDAFQRATGRRLVGEEREQFLKFQLQANRWTYLGSGMTNPNFLETVELLRPEARKQIENMSPMFR
jgi:hypothetical protein